MSDGGTITLILICLLLEGFFSGGEIALVASDIGRIRQKAAAGSRPAARVLKLLEKPEWFFAATLTGTDFCIIAASALSTSLFISWFGPRQGEFISALVMIPIILIFGEIIPKSLFQQKAESISLKLSGFVTLASWIFYPVVFIVSRISRGMVSLFMRQRTQTHFSYITTGGLKVLLSEKSGAATDVRLSERQMVGRVLDFSGEAAGDIMVPLSNVKALERKTTLREAFLQFKEKWYSRIPVYDREIVNIIGILYGFDLLKVPPENFDQPVEKFMTTPVYYVPETKRAGELLIEMQRRGRQMAIIVNEYGGSVGIITVEDLLEEIVGEIEDEYDRGVDKYRKVGKERYLFDARSSLETLRNIVQVDLPEGDYETLGGFLLDRMGRIPRKGESLKLSDVLFVIQEADPKSIKEVLIIVPQKEKES